MNFNKPFLVTFAVTLGLLAATGVLAWTGPSASPPSGNASAPVNTSATSQIKNGAFTATSIGGSTVCVGVDCRSAWPSGGTSQWTTNGSNIYYNTGNVGIGTANPAFTFVIQKDGLGIFLYQAANSLGPIFSTRQSNGTNAAPTRTVAGNVLSRFDFNGYTAGPSYDTAAQILVTADTGWSATSGDAPGRIDFSTQADGGGGLIPRLSITSGGNVGIGVTAPYASEFQVTGSSQPADNPSSALLSLTTGTGVGADNKLSFGVHDSDYSWIQAFQNGIGYRNLVLNALGGNVGIGNTLPNSDLTVGATNGVSNALISARQNGDSIEWGNGNTAGYGGTLGDLAGGGNPYVAFNSQAGTTANTFKTTGVKGSGVMSDNNGGISFFTIASINANNQTPSYMASISSGGAVTASSFLYSSDARLKTNVVTVSANSALADILGLRPVTYNWIDPTQPTTTQLGFIAQEVEQIAPELVSTNPLTTLKAVDYARVAPLLVGAVQAQQTQLDAQQKEIDMLKAEVEALKAGK